MHTFVHKKYGFLFIKIQFAQIFFYSFILIGKNQIYINNA